MADRVLELENAIKRAIERFDNVNWGWDGDCGVNNIMDELEEVIDDG